MKIKYKAHLIFDYFTRTVNGEIDMSNVDLKTIDWNGLDKEVKIWEETTKHVITDLRDRHATGLRKYGVALSTNTKEDMLQHLYEEILDAAVYIKTLINQRKEQKVKVMDDYHHGSCC